MILRITSRVALAACITGFSALAMAEEAAKHEPPASMKLDADPPKDAAPDPLAPAEQDGPPPAAPGEPAEAAQPPVPEQDPIAAQILAHLPNVGKGEAREDLAGTRRLLSRAERPAHMDLKGWLHS